MVKLQYDSFYKFIVSLGLVLVVFPMVVFYFIFKETGGFLISEMEFRELSAFSLRFLENRDILWQFFISFFPVACVVSMGIGLLLFFYGLFHWKKIQKEYDAQICMKTKKDQKELEKMSPIEIVTEKIGETANRIKELPFINAVKYGEGMVENIVGAFDIISRGTIVIVIALILVTAFLISNTIKLTIFSRKSEIEIMRLVGASNIAIKLPFIFEGFILGVLGSVIPTIVTIYGYHLLYDKLGGHVFSNIIQLVEPFNFVFYVSFILLLIGAIVGMFGSYRAVRKHLKI